MKARQVMHDADGPHAIPPPCPIVQRRVRPPGKPRRPAAETIDELLQGSLTDLGTAVAFGLHKLPPGLLTGIEERALYVLGEVRAELRRRASTQWSP